MTDVSIVPEPMPSDDLPLLPDEVVEARRLLRCGKSRQYVAEWFGCSVDNIPEDAKLDTSAAGLRDVLFDEIIELRANRATPDRAKAVAGLAKEIINAARTEAMIKASGK